MPVFEEEEKKCEEFTDFWIYSYGDMVTLLLTFFILLFSFCKVDVEKFKSVAESFKPTPPGTPFFLEGKESVLEGVAAAVETTELSDEVYVTIDERGVVVAFKDSALFEPASARILPRGQKTLDRFARLLYGLPNDVTIEGHTDDQPIKTAQFPSNWELSAARAGSVARFFEDNGVKGQRMEVIGRGPYNPRFANDTPAKRSLNRRVEVIIKPD
ncbi:MAG: OmpA family protein [SAR324 cluster bacterium]|nr:OmpA family protein [SAR324 cluster bacterium]